MRFLVCTTSIVFAIGVLGCEKEEQKDRSAEPIASVDKAAAIDPALAKAVAQASAVMKAKRAPAGTPGGPPASGIFEPGAADKEAPRGVPPKITLGDSGKEPRVIIGPLQPKPGWKSAGTVQVLLQGGDPRQQPLPVRVALLLEAQKPKSVDAGADAAPADAVAVTARVKSAEIAAAGLPQEVAARISALKGAKIEYLVGADGSGTGYRYDLPGAASELVDYLRVLSDALALVTLPVPKVPLGAGGFFMATTREGVYGLDLVTYRMVKVEKIEGETITLAVNTKRYASSNRFDFTGLPPDLPREMIEFDAASDARLELKVGAPFPSGGEIGSMLAAKLPAPAGMQGMQGAPAGAQQVLAVQTQSRIGLSFPDTAGPAAKKAAASGSPSTP
jgi:hypothetical protein